MIMNMSGRWLGTLMVSGGVAVVNGMWQQVQHPIYSKRWLRCTYMYNHIVVADFHMSQVLTRNIYLCHCRFTMRDPDGTNHCCEQF